MELCFEEDNPRSTIQRDLRWESERSGARHMGRSPGTGSESKSFGCIIIIWHYGPALRLGWQRVLGVGKAPGHGLGHGVRYQYRGGRHQIRGACLASQVRNHWVDFFVRSASTGPLEIRGDKSLDRPIGEVDLVLRCASHTSCSWGELTLTYVSCRESFSTCVKQCCERVVDRNSINSWADDA